MIVSLQSNGENSIYSFLIIFFIFTHCEKIKINKRFFLSLSKFLNFSPSPPFSSLKCKVIAKAVLQFFRHFFASQFSCYSILPFRFACLGLTYFHSQSHNNFMFLKVLIHSSFIVFTIFTTMS